MLRVVGIKDNGDLIIEKTSSMGKTDEPMGRVEGIYKILKRKQESEVKQAQEEDRHMEESQAEMIPISADGQTVVKTLIEITEKLIQDFQPIIEACKQIAAFMADTMESLNEILEVIREKTIENRIKSERQSIYGRIEHSRRRGGVWQQVKAHLKYRPYELRIY